VSVSVAPSFAFRTLETSLGPVTYTVLVPEGLGPHPAILALPPGSQNRAMVVAGLELWREQMVADGFLVVSPVAPDSGLFTCACSHDRLPELLDHVAAEYSVAEGWWMLFGISNGGRSALVVGAAYPERFRSVTVLPGATSTPSTLGPLAGLRTTFAVGSRDDGWLACSRSAHSYLRGIGGESELVVLEGKGHAAFQSVPWPRLRSWLTRI